MDYDLLTDEERKEREGIWIVTCPHCGVGHGVRVDDSDLQATIAEQAATISSYRALVAWLDGTDVCWEFDSTEDEYADLRHAIAVADMGEDG